MLITANIFSKARTIIGYCPTKFHDLMIVAFTEVKLDR